MINLITGGGRISPDLVCLRTRERGHALSDQTVNRRHLTDLSCSPRPWLSAKTQRRSKRPTRKLACVSLPHLLELQIAPQVAGESKQWGKVRQFVIRWRCAVQSANSNWKGILHRFGECIAALAMPISGPHSGDRDTGRSMHCVLVTKSACTAQCAAT